MDWESPGPSQSADGTSYRFAEIPQHSKIQEHLDVNIDETLAQNVTDLFRWGMKEDLYSEIIKDESNGRPANCEGLVTVETNQEIWDQMSVKTRTRDVKLKFIETSVITAGTLLAKVVNSLKLAENESVMCEDVMGKCTTTLALLGHTNRKICLTRREFLKPELKLQYAKLCNHSVPYTGYLFGENELSEVVYWESQSSDGTSYGFAGIPQRSKIQEHLDVNIDETLAQNVTDLFRWGMKEDLYSEIIKDETNGRPANCEGLVTVETNQEIWDLISAKARTRDVKLKNIGTAVVTAATVLAKVVNSLTLVENESVMCEDVMSKSTTALALLGHTNRQICLTRREFLKPELRLKYAKLCNQSVPYTGYLFGDNVTRKAQEIKDKLGNLIPGWGKGGVRGQSVHQRGRGVVRGNSNQRGGRGIARGQSSHRGDVRGQSVYQGNLTGRGRGFSTQGKSSFHSPSDVTSSSGHRKYAKKKEGNKSKNA